MRFEELAQSLLSETSHSSVFKPKDFIVTKDGFRGVVIKRLDYAPSMYEIKLASGYAVYPAEDLEKDPLMDLED